MFVTSRQSSEGRGGETRLERGGCRGAALGQEDLLDLVPCSPDVLSEEPELPSELLVWGLWFPNLWFLPRQLR